MASDIKINNPEEVKQSLRRIEAALMLHDEHIKQERACLVSLESTIVQTKQAVSARRRGLQIAIEQAKKKEELEGAEEAIQEFQQRADMCDEHIRTLNRCHEELYGLQTAYGSIVKQSDTLAQQGRMIFEKTSVLIDRIMQAL